MNAADANDDIIVCLFAHLWRCLATILQMSSGSNYYYTAPPLLLLLATLTIILLYTNVNAFPSCIYRSPYFLHCIASKCNGVGEAKIGGSVLFPHPAKSAAN